jgi:hypothetical protein
MVAFATVFTGELQPRCVLGSFMVKQGRRRHVLGVALVTRMVIFTTVHFHVSLETFFTFEPLATLHADVVLFVGMLPHMVL